MTQPAPGGTVSETRRQVRIGALCAAALLVFAACGGDDDDGAATGAPTDATDETDAPAADGTGDETAGAETSAVTNEWALAYTGGTEGPADESLEPVVIGYVNQEGGVPSFPEATIGLDAAVAYVNTELGGAGGHPIEIVECIVQAEEDGQRCATEMLNNDDIAFVMTGVMVVGNGSFYSTLSGKKPVIVGFPAVPDDFIAADAYAFTPGAVGVVKGMSTFVGEYLDDVESVAVVHADNASGQASVDLFLKPGLEAQGITDVKAVAVPDTATAPDVAAAIQAAGGDTADLFVPLLTVQGCAATYDALQSLGVQPKVLTTGLCYGTPMTSHLADLGLDDPVPEGWYFGDLGYSYFIPDDESGMSTYLSKIAEYGPADTEYTGYAGPLFANLLTSVKLVNQVGADAVTSESMRTAAAGFTGPMMLVAGPMRCGFDAVFKSLCGTQMGVQQYADGSWTSIANALNGQAIETAPAS
jgi:branched-chain amino acid transport system substrate-binding protein